MKELSGFAREGGFRCLEFTPTGDGAPDRAIVYLHGAGERGDDVQVLKRYGLPLLLASGAARVDCAVLCPQLDANGDWEPDRLAMFLAGVRATFPKLALIGYSLGGQGVCDVVARHGPVANLAIAIAGRGGEEVLAPQGGVVAVAISGEVDALSSTTAFLRGVRTKGGLSHEIVLPGHGHFISEIALEEPLCRSLLEEAGFNIRFARDELQA